MPSRRSIATIGLVIGLTLVACSGSAVTPGSAPTPDDRGGTPGADATQTAPTSTGGDATQTAPTSTGADAETSPPVDGGGTADACALLTTDEVAAATGQSGIEAQPVAQAETDALSACGFVSNGTSAVVITAILDPANTNTDASTYLLLPGSVEVPVNGARAIFMPAGGYVMVVVKGGTVATFQVAMPAEGEDFQVTATKLVQKFADRMP